MAFEMEDSLLDLTAHVTTELLDQLATAVVEEHDELILKHIKKLTSNTLLTSVFDPNEKGEWISGVKDQSLAAYCNGKVALLDFFTYCCINCQHILPDLHDLEKLYSSEDGLVVVGIHSAKFDAERLPMNVLHAIQRLNIKHPVLNDPEAKLWTRLGVHCWPTLLLLSPDGKPLFVFPGEGHRENLFRAVAVSINHYRNIEMLNRIVENEFLINIQDINNPKSLKFPGKVSLNPFSKLKEMEPWLTISDSGNNRIILVDVSYKVTHIIGGMNANLRDGDFQEAKFNNPQGVCWLNSNTLVVCDTGNHVLRRVSLDLGKVEILAGTGIQAEFGDIGGQKYCQQSLSSPWDVVLYKTADMDMSIRKPIIPADDEIDLAGAELDAIRRVLLVAAAGSHQIWAVFLDTTVWWKYKTYAEGTVMPIVGSGREENRNNRYPNSASLAQPSGLSLNGDAVYIADSESSSIRHLDLKSGQISPFVGADRNPCNLFAYGDADGKGYAAKLQHPLGVSFYAKSSTLFVADTYNHKIKSASAPGADCTTFYPTSDSEITLSEPGGLCVVAGTQSIIIADTNNHQLLTLDINTKECNKIDIEFPEESQTEIIKKDDFSHGSLIICPDVLNISDQESGRIILHIDCYVQRVEKDLDLTPGAPQRWLVKIFNTNMLDISNDWEFVGGARNGRELPGKVEIRRKPGYHKSYDDSGWKIRIEYFLSLCESKTCSIRRFAVDCQLEASNEVVEEQNYSLDVKIMSDGDMKVASKNINVQ